MKRHHVISADKKRLALERIANGEAVSAIASDLGVHRQRLYDWQARVREGGLSALRGPGRPRKPALRLLPWNASAAMALQELMARRARTARLGSPPG